MIPKLKFLLLLFIPVSMAGQLTPVTNQYVLNPLTINPAYAGNRGALNIATFYRRQWVGISGAPETMNLTADAPFLNKKLGLGLVIMNDKIGVTKETAFKSFYSYKISIKQGILSLGLGAGLITTNTKWSELVVLDPGDDFYLIDSKMFVVPDFSFGIYYSYQNYFAGFSVPKLVSYKFDFDKNRYTLKVKPLDYNYMFNTGYIFDIAPKMRFFPSALVTYTPDEKILYDFNAHFNFLERFWIGASYRNNRSVAGLFQFQINPRFKIAYSYDFDLGKLSKYSNGSHEVMLRYEFMYKVDVVNPLNF